MASRKSKPAKAKSPGTAVAKAELTTPQAIGLSTSTPPRRGTKELLQLYGQSPWMRAIVGKISKAVANTEWHIAVPTNTSDDEKMRRLARVCLQAPDIRWKTMKRLRKAEEVKKNYNHPILDLIETGNDLLPGHLCVQVTEIYLDMVGEAFWLLEKNGLGKPVQYWPLPPDWVRDIPSKGSPFFMVQPRAGATMQIPATEIIWFKEPDPANPYQRGSGIGRSLGDEFEIDEYSAKHMKSFFYNRARPDIIISGDNISYEDAKRLEQKWLSDHQGFWRAFKPLFFSRKIDIKELTQNFENIQMVNVRKHERDMFIQVFGAPPEKFGIVNESKRSTIAAADYFWTKDVVQPRMEFIRRTLQIFLVPMFDERIVLDYESPVIQDKDFALEVMKAQNAAFTINDWRELAGTEDLGPAGDVLVVPLNHEFVPIGGKPTNNPGASDEDDEPVGDEEPDESEEEPEDDSSSSNDEDKKSGKATNVIDFEEVRRLTVEGIVKNVRDRLKERLAKG